MSKAIITGFLITMTATDLTAQPAGDRARATRLFNEGNTLRESGDHSAALGKYEAAYALFGSYRIDFNMALSLEALGRDPEAADRFERFLRLGAARSPADKVQLARDHLQVLREQVSSMVLACPVHEASVMIDGRHRGKTPLAGPIYLAPGKHTLKVLRGGYHPSELELDLAAAEHRTVKVELRKRAAVVPITAAGLALERRRARKSLWAYTAMGVGAAFATCAVALYAVGGARGSAAHDDYQQATSTAGDPARALQHRAEIEAAQDEISAGHVFLGLAAAAAGVAIYQLVTRPAAASPAVALSARPGGAGFTLDVGF